MLDFDACICMFGMFVKMSLLGLQPCVDILRLVIFRRGCMYLLSFVWV